MKNLVLLFKNNNLYTSVIDDNIVLDTVIIQQEEYLLKYSVDEGMIAFIDWFFDENNYLIKLDFHFLHIFVSEDIEIDIGKLIAFKHEYNLGGLLLKNDKNIDEKKSILQTFSFSAFLTKNNKIKGFLINIEDIFLQI